MSRQTLLALVVFAVAVGTLVVVLRARSPAQSDVVADARVTCSGERTEVTPAETTMQEFGLVVDVHGLEAGDALTFFPQNGPDRPAYPVNVSVYPAPTPGGPRRAHVRLPPGRVLVVCGVPDTPRGAVPLDVSDPDGRGQRERDLACSPDPLDSDAGYPYITATPFSIKENPLPDALYRSIPGVRPTDRIEGVSFPPRHPDAAQGFVVRDGQAVAYVSLSPYGGRWFPGLAACPTSGIGRRPAEIRLNWGPDLLATPYRLSGVSRCDPYSETCDALYTTAAWYEERTDDDVRIHAKSPSAACTPRQPYGCRPDPERFTISVLLSPDDYAAFVAREHCGTSETDLCR